jgi:glycosyltransferase involved in cell wall biosynthesis
MRLLFVADGRSPTALNWLNYWMDAGHQTHLISSYPCRPIPGLRSFQILPLAFSGVFGARSGSSSASNHKSRFPTRLRDPLRILRYYFGPLSLSAYQEQYLARLSFIKPDLVHALRIPFEGMLASLTPASIPLLVSIWGNDLTLHAHGSSLMARHTRQTLSRINALLADTSRDIRLANEMGFSSEKPSLVVPGSGGLFLDEMQDLGPYSTQPIFPEPLPDVPLVVNPRGQRPGSLRQDVFFRAIPLVLEKVPQVLFVCPSLDTDAVSRQLVNRLGIASNTRLWPRLDQATLWALLRQAQVFVSPSVHDGTPNSLLEAMACGCFPVVGNIESMREWILAGENGLLVDASSPAALAQAIITGLTSPSLRAEAKKKNASIIAARAEYGRCMATVEAFYEDILKTG